MFPTVTYNGKECDKISTLLREQTRWEKVPNRKEPVTEPMLRDMHQHAATTGDPDDIHHVVAEFATIGAVGGAFRLTEWAQENDVHKNGTKKNIDGSHAAFTLDDMIFYGKNNKRLRQSDRQLLNEDDVYKVSFRWRFQKNGENGEIKTLSRADHVHMCGPRMAVRIRNRAIKLKISSKSPLAVYVNRKAKRPVVRHIRPIEIEKVFQASAARVFDLDPTKKADKETLKKWTSHSLRVGACVALHMTGADATLIKFRCRWRSDACLICLCDVPHPAELHATKINALADKCS